MDAVIANIEIALFERWNDLASAFIPELKEKWWKRLTSIYNERPFHNLKHLNMFQLFDEYKDKLQERMATALAIFFLHAVHDPKHSNNAERSAELLQQFSSEATFDLVNYSTALILRSGKHCTDAHLTPDTHGEGDVHFLLDFDIAFLGVDEIEYDMHSKNIRNEYDHLNDDQYRQQRLKVLKLFMRIPNIYATRKLRKRFKTQARLNIAREISDLSK